MKNWTIVALVATVGVLSTLGVVAATQPPSVTVEVVVWEHAPTERVYLSTRSAGGQWTTHDIGIEFSPHPGYSGWNVGKALMVTVPLGVGPTPWCRGRPQWQSAARDILPGDGDAPVTGFYSGDAIAHRMGHRDHILPWATLCQLVDTDTAARAAFNHLRNLVPATAVLDVEKSDGLADEWLPAWERLNPAGHAAHACEYATRYREVAETYGHPLSRSEVDHLDRACPDDTSPGRR